MADDPTIAEVCAAIAKAAAFPGPPRVLLVAGRLINTKDARPSARFRQELPVMERDAREICVIAKPPVTDGLMRPDTAAGVHEAPAAPLFGLLCPRLITAVLACLIIYVYLYLWLHGWLA